MSRRRGSTTASMNGMPAPADADVAVASGAALHRFARNVLVADSLSPDDCLAAEGRRAGGPGGNAARGSARQDDDGAQAWPCEADRLGADGLILTTEVWGAPVVEPDDPRFALRATGAR